MKDFVEGTVHIGIAVSHPDQLRGVYAVLASQAALAAALAVVDGTAAPKSPVAAPAAAPSASAAEASPPAAEEASGEVEIDAHGHPWSADLHTGTKGKTKEDLWRMKPGVTRPDPLPGFPKADAGNGGTGTKIDGPAPDAGATAAAASAGQANEEEDEFAAFASSGATAEAVVRTWTDADLSLLNNQAAQVLGGPDKVRELIAKYVTPGETTHSRNIPADKREEYAQAIEAVAGIEFAG